MKRRLPILPTLLVLVAVAAMIGLGVWQLRRRQEKAVLLALYARNADRPVVALAGLRPISDRDLFRSVAATCRRVTGWTVVAGHGVAGQSGWSHIARCTTSGSGKSGGGTLLVDLGTSRSPVAPATWRGGPIRGRLVWAPEGRPLIARLVSPGPPPTPLLVAADAAPGLSPTAPPDPADVPNNHLAYAVQWFLFALVAILVYGAALVRRRKTWGREPAAQGSGS